MAPAKKLLAPRLRLPQRSHQEHTALEIPESLTHRRQDRSCWRRKQINIPPCVPAGKKCIRAACLRGEQLGEIDGQAAVVWGSKQNHPRATKQGHKGEEGVWMERSPHRQAQRP